MNNIRRYIDLAKGHSKIFEKNYSGALYHATDRLSGYNIINNRNINLTEAPPGGREIEYSPKKDKGYKYYLSTSRDKLNSYRKHNVRNLYVTLVLNPNSFRKQGYSIVPMNYFGYSSTSRREEAEERIWSKTGTIEFNSTNIPEIHIYIATSSIPTMQMIYKHQDDIKELGIQAYYYDNYAKYLLMDKKYAGFRLEITSSREKKFILNPVK